MGDKKQGPLATLGGENRAVKTRITLYGAPATKKNSQRIIVNKATGRPMMIQSRQYREYETACLWQLKGYRGPRFREPVTLKAEYWVPDRRKRDLGNLLAATTDILEKAGVIADDALVVSFDGSRIRGVDRENPRVEIELRGESVSG